MASSKGIRAGKAFVEIFADDSRLVRGLKAAQAKLKAFGEGLKTIGAKMLKIGAAIAAPLAASVHLFSEMGDSVAKMARRTGMSAEAVSELGFAAEQSGTDVETLEVGIKRMQKTLAAAAGGSKEAANLLAELGLTIDELRGLAPEEQFKLLADRIARIQSPAVRAAMALQLFGKSGTMLLPLMADGAKGIQQLQEQARELGLTISTTDATAAESLNDTLNILWRSVKAASFAVGGALAPTVEKATWRIVRIIKAAADWVRQNKELVVTALKVALAVTLGGAVIYALGVAFGFAASIIGGAISVIAGIHAALAAIGTVLGILLTPIGLVGAAIVGIAGYFIYTSGAAGRAVAWLQGVFNDLKETATTAFGAIGNALAAGDIGLAAKVLWLTLKLEWQKGVNFLNKTWLEWKFFFIRVFNEAVFNLSGILTDAWAGLEVAWVESTTFMLNAWTTFTSGLLKGWRTAQNFISKGVLRLMSLFDSSVDVDAAGKILDEDMARANAKTDADATRTKADREQHRQDRRRQIEQYRQGARSQIEAMRGEEERKIADEENKGLDESKKALDDARKEWQKAIGEAGAATPLSDKKPPDWMKNMSGVGDEIDAVHKRTIGVAGSFNAAAARALSAGGISDKATRAAEATAVNTKKLVEQAQHGGLVFAGADE